jgi:hypothetical protein
MKGDYPCFYSGNYEVLFMQISRNLVVFCLLCTALFCAGCTQSASPVTDTPGSDAGTVINPGQLALAPSEFPQGSILTGSRSKNPSDMSRLALDLGWQGGHVVRYTVPSQDGKETYEITQSIALYPERTIPDVIAFSYQQAHSDRDMVYSDFAARGLGGSAKAFSGKAGIQIPLKTGNDNPVLVSMDSKETQSDTKTDFAEVIFSKGKTFEVITITGPSPDTAFLLNVSQTAYAKIP